MAGQSLRYYLHCEQLAVVFLPHLSAEATQVHLRKAATSKDVEFDEAVVADGAVEAGEVSEVGLQ